MKYSKMKGFRDIFGEDIEYWQYVESKLKSLFTTYGFNEFRLPILEKTALFNRGIGDTTDIVEKEMFSFEDKDGEFVSLRPEGTASLLRAYIENGLINNGVKKFYYLGNMFRRERPQKGRFRQFTQIGVEVLESSSALLDAEIASLLYNSAKILELENIVELEINSLGCKECRPSYNELLISYFKNIKEDLCGDCNRRLERNPLRILDCKNENCKKLIKDAPIMLDNLCVECSDHFTLVKKHLGEMNIPYKINPFMVRGLDYYIRTAFELVTTMLGSASAVGAGGRYDGLIKTLGGSKDTAGIGFAIGIDRLVELLQQSRNLPAKQTDYFILFFEDTLEHGLKIVNSLREKGFIVEYDYDQASMKSQMKKSNKLDAKFTVILGEDEIQSLEVTVKDMLTGDQQRMSIVDLCAIDRD